VDARGRLTTNSPGDVFKIVNETLNVLSYCNNIDMTFGLLETCGQTLGYFQKGLQSAAK
jgi:hypothetical protein